MPYKSIYHQTTCSKRCVLLNSLLKLITICSVSKSLRHLDVQDASRVQAKVLSTF